MSNEAEEITETTSSIVEIDAPKTNEDLKLAELKAALEVKKEAIKGRLNLNDKEFEILIKDSIVASYLELGLRIREDDPIFAVILSQKRVMDYYAFLIAKALENTPAQIGNAIESKVSDVKDIMNTFVEELEEFEGELIKELNSKTIENNNAIVTSFGKFIDQKTEEFKRTIESIRPPQNMEIINANQNSRLMSLLMSVLLFVSIGLSSFSIFNSSTKPKDKDIELQYQKGLINGFSEISKNFNTKDAEKIEKIIVGNIDNQLKK